MQRAPMIAIVGKPNVGKSTLFNRLIGKKHAIIAEEAGTTRDRLIHEFECDEYHTLLVDTGGLEYGKRENIEEDIQSQATLAITDADLILFVISSIQDLGPDDFAAAEIIRRSNKPIILVANKCDNPIIEQNILNIYELGFGEPVKISAIHKVGLDVLEGTIGKKLHELKFKKGIIKKKNTHTNICILGKPNAGKSSLVNALLGSEKIIVSDVAGTTRDAIDTEITFNNQLYNLIDTAGLRRRGKRERGIEKFSAMRCISSIERADIVALTIDGNVGLTNQDCHIAQYALEAKKGLMIVINKSDLFEQDEQKKDRLIAKVRRRFAFVPWAPVVFTSATNKKNTHKILELADEITAERNKRVPTAEGNSFFQKVTYKHLPASAKVKKPRFSYGTQADVNPPTFVLFFSNPKNLHFTYPRYLENKIREEYGFIGTAINLKIKNKHAEDDPK